MTKSEKREQARAFRKQGKSVKSIAKEIGVSRSSVSDWCHGIVLTPFQIDALQKNWLKGTYAGRMKGAATNKERKQRSILDGQKYGLEYIRSLSDRDLMMLGIGLFLGEGSKQDNRFKLSNSNSFIIQLCILWLRKCFGVHVENLIFHVLVNEIHRSREDKIICYWQNITGATRQQFTKTTFIQVKNKKIYANFHEHYGTLCLSVRKSSSLQYKILGLCYVLREEYIPKMPA